VAARSNCPLDPKTFHPKLSHRILRCIHEVLNIDKIKN
jgi:hypothetical protein